MTHGFRVIDLLSERSLANVARVCGPLRAVEAQPVGVTVRLQWPTFGQIDRLMRQKPVAPEWHTAT